MESETWWILSLLFSSVGMAYFIYGKKQKRPVPLLSGVALCSFTYFVTQPVPCLILGAVLVILPYFLRL